MSEIIFFSESKQLFFCRNDVQAIDFLRKGSYAPGGNWGETRNIRYWAIVNGMSITGPA